ncbi:MAG TPA: RNA polymerase sigma factor [Polyangia bacterium]|nr:RNA polymerase sigma factor [Polyangia bacterium]
MRDGSPGVLRLVPRAEGDSPPAGAPELDDRALVAAIRRGDAGCASALCDRVWPQVDRTVRRLLGNADADRDDVGQLALIEIVTTIDRYRGDCSLDGWAQTITSHVIFKHIRRRRIERRIFTDLLASGAVEAPAATHTERGSTTRQLLARVAAHLDGMNDGRAWAFVMHDVLGYDLREIAEMTASSVAAAQSRLVRGRRDLHARIADDPELADLMLDFAKEKTP